MKGEWHTRPFEECIAPVTYSQKVQRKDFLGEGLYPVISQEEDFVNGYWDKKADLFRVTTPLVVFGDHTKVLKYVDFDFVLGADGVKVLQPREFLLPKFFFYQLQRVTLASLGYARHYKLLKALEITYPDLHEQQRIVDMLDDAFQSLATAKANAEKNLHNARALFESHLQSVFTQRGQGWVEERIGAVCTLKSGTTVVATLEKAAGDLPYLKVADMTHSGNETDIVSSSRFLNWADIGRNAVFPPGTTIFPKRGGSILTNKKRLTAVPICADLNIMGVVPGKRLLPKFLYFYFVNVDMRQIGSGSSIPQINNYDIEPLVLSFPDSAEQQGEIVRVLEVLSGETQRLESIYRRKVEAVDVLKMAFLQQAFSGQL